MTDLALPGQKVTRDLASLYQNEFARLCGLLRRLGVPDKDLEDAVHDVFIVVHRRWEDLDPDRPAAPWLSGIAVRVASQWRRKASVRHETAMEPVEQPTQGPDALGLLEGRRAQARVVAALDALAKEQRTVFVLNQLEGFTIPEIATSLGIPLNTAYSRLRLARERFVDAVLRGPNQEARA